ncbi:MAG: hypothetical protein WCQ96_02600 [Patescibacteria group bacterium]
MEIEFKNPKHEAQVNDYETLCKKYNKKGIDCATDILDTIGVLYAADTLFDVPRSYRPHPLQGGYKGCFSVDVTNIYRVIFKPDKDKCHDFRIDTFKSISAIIIIEIFIDDHKSS